MTDKKTETLWIERQRRYADFQDGIDLEARDKRLAEIDKMNRKKMGKGRLMTEKKATEKQREQDQIAANFNPPTVDLAARTKNILEKDKEMAKWRGDQIDLKAKEDKTKGKHEDHC